MLNAVLILLSLSKVDFINIIFLLDSTCPWIINLIKMILERKFNRQIYLGDTIHFNSLTKLTIVVKALTYYEKKF